METLVYLSEYIPSTGSAQSAVNHIIEKAIENNRQHELTGVLFFHNHIFMQVLEGPTQKLHTIFEKIKKDSRHKNIEIIYQSEIDKRHFPDWQMQLFNLDNETRFAPDTIQRIQQIYEQNLKFNALDFIELLQSSLNDENFLKEINK